MSDNFRSPIESTQEGVGQFKLHGVLVNGVKMCNYRHENIFLNLAVGLLNFITDVV